MTGPKTPEGKAKLKQERAIDGAQAMVEYRAAEQAERAKMASLRGERLAREPVVPLKSRITFRPGALQAEATGQGAQDLDVCV
jgi:hypothetical protein